MVTSSEPASQQEIVNTNKRQRTNDGDEDEIEASEAVKETNYKYRKVRLEGQDRIDTGHIIKNKHAGQSKDYYDTQVLKQKEEIDAGKL
jgi:hypothetical protein